MSAAVIGHAKSPLRPRRLQQELSGSRGLCRGGMGTAEAVRAVRKTPDHQRGTRARAELLNASR